MVALEIASIVNHVNTISNIQQIVSTNRVLWNQMSEKDKKRTRELISLCAEQQQKNKKQKDRNSVGDCKTVYNLTDEQQQEFNRISTTQVHETDYWYVPDFTLYKKYIPISSFELSCLGHTLHAKYVTIIQSTIKNGGLGLSAARDYDKGEIILMESPYMTAGCDSTRCWFCSKLLTTTTNIIQCRNKCDYEQYCSTVCCESAWNQYHQVQCSNDRSKRWDMKPVIDNVLRGFSMSSRIPLLILRLIAKAKVEKLFSVLDLPVIQSMSRSFKSFMNNNNNNNGTKPNNNNTAQIGLNQAICQYYQILLAARMTDDMDRVCFEYMTFDYLRLLLSSNIYGLFSHQKNQSMGLGFGCAIYETATLCNHSCDPNVDEAINPDDPKSRDSIVLTANHL